MTLKGIVSGCLPTCWTDRWLPVRMHYVNTPGVRIQVGRCDYDHVMSGVLVGSTDGLIGQPRPVDVINKQGQPVAVRTEEKANQSKVNLSDLITIINEHV